jgi:hypothetical protein
MKNFTSPLLQKFRPSGLITGIIIGALAVITLQKINFNTKMAANLLPAKGGIAQCGLTQMPASSTTYGIIATEAEYNTAVNSYQQANPNGT